MELPVAEWPAPSLQILLSEFKSVQNGAKNRGNLRMRSAQPRLGLRNLCHSTVLSKLTIHYMMFAEMRQKTEYSDCFPASQIRGITGKSKI
jgi:hypothetical protein